MKPVDGTNLSPAVSPARKKNKKSRPSVTRNSPVIEEDIESIFDQIEKAIYRKMSIFNSSNRESQDCKRKATKMTEKEKRPKPERYECPNGAQIRDFRRDLKFSDETMTTTTRR